MKDLSLNGMSKSELLDAYNPTDEDCIDAIKENLTVPDTDLNQDAINIFKHFSNMSKNALIMEFILSLAETESYRFDFLAAELDGEEE